MHFTKTLQEVVTKGSPQIILTKMIVDHCYSDALFYWPATKFATPTPIQPRTLAKIRPGGSVRNPVVSAPPWFLDHTIPTACP